MNSYEKFHNKILDDVDAGRKVSPVKAIRAFCLECVGYNSEEVKECTANNQKNTRCPLFRFRFGKTGFHKTLKTSPATPTIGGLGK